MSALPGIAIVIPVEFPLRIDDDDVVTVFVQGKPGRPLIDKFATVMGRDVLNFGHAPSRGNGAILVTSKMPTMKVGELLAPPSYQAVHGLLIFGPCK